MTDAEAIVELRHARALGYCARGMRMFFAHHALDWETFRTNGLPASTIAATGDAMAQAVVELAQREQRGDQ